MWMTPGQIIRKGQWADWQKNANLECHTQACLDAALEKSLGIWTQAFSRHQESVKQATHEALREIDRLRAAAVEQGQQEGLARWVEQLLVWTQERRSSLRSLRDDIAEVLCEVLSQTLQSLSTAELLATVLHRLDPLIDGKHPLKIQVAQDEYEQATATIDAWWQSAGWVGAAPLLSSSPILQAGQCRVVSIAGELEVDLPAFLEAATRCIWDSGAAHD